MTNTQYWIIVASKDHVQKGVQGGFAQACHGKASPLQKMKNGDFVIYYSGKTYFDTPEKCQKFTAIGRIEDDTVFQVEMEPGFCPSRIKVNFFPCREVPIRPLIHQLDCIPNKKHWGYPFRKGILKIDAHDFNLVAEQMTNATTLKV